METLKTCFNFDKLRSFCQGKGPSTLLFDGMHGAGGPFARKIFVDELGLPEVSVSIRLFLDSLGISISKEEFCNSFSYFYETCRKVVVFDEMRSKT